MHQRWDQDIKCQDQDQVTFKTENKTKTVKTLSLLETVARDSRPWCAFMFSVCRVIVSSFAVLLQFILLSSQWVHHLRQTARLQAVCPTLPSQI